MQTSDPKNSDPKDINSLMQQGKLGGIMHKIATIRSLNKALYQILEPALRPYCQVVNFENNTIIVSAKNSPIANTLYYMQNEILGALQQVTPKRAFTQIKIKIRMG